jgi:NTE family protein
LNALLMDAVEFDMERLARINATVDLIPQSTRMSMQLRKIEYLWIRPSQDIGKIASGLYHKLPSVIRYLVSGLGSQKEASELTSYLLFDPEFCGALSKLGREDALANREAVIKFFTA